MITINKSPCEYYECKLANRDKMNNYCRDCKLRTQYVDFLEGKINMITARPPDIDENLITPKNVNSNTNLDKFISECDKKIKKRTNFESYADIVEYLYCQVGYDFRMIKHSIFNYLGRGFVKQEAIFKIIQDNNLVQGSLTHKKNTIKIKCKDFC